MISNLTGIILRKQDWGDKDLRLTVLSETGERLELIVKGANLPGSKRRAHCELMNLIEGTVYQSTKNLYLQNVQAKNSFLHFKENIDHVFRLSVFLEILDRCLQPQEPEASVYALLHETLLHLNQASNPFIPEVAMIRLAHILGFLPSFKNCHSCHEAILEEAHWNQEAGTLACKDCRTHEGRSLPLKYRKAFEFFRNARLEECERVQLSTEETQILREWIPNFFSVHLDRPLKSLQVQF